MTTSNMIAALELAIQNCSLNRSTTSEDDGFGVDDRSSDSPPNLTDSAATLELNSHAPLLYQWEQCLDLETGEIYYINWENGTKATEDPRNKSNLSARNYYSTKEEEEEEEENGGGGGGDGSSSTCTFREDFGEEVDDDHVLVVAGCKWCLMYFMLPKRVIECPKCKKPSSSPL